MQRWQTVLPMLLLMSTAKYNGKIKVIDKMRGKQGHERLL
jgi:hypothetical protein